MDRFLRYYKLHALLKSHHHPISRSKLELELEASKATVKRIICELRNYGAPIEYSRDPEGYSYVGGHAYELPGMWFMPDELCALLTVHDLLVNAEPGLLQIALAPLKRKLEGFMKLEHLGVGELPKRVRILRMAGRGPGCCFQQVAQSLVSRKQLRFEYRSRQDGETSNRLVSPQRLTHYRDNWYLDAWCHSRKALRSFALECIADARISSAKARECEEPELDTHFASAYGIFAGVPTATAILVFSEYKARWVADEQWHPQQRASFLDDGRYRLEIPYSDPRELLMDILKYGSDVEVVAPLKLRELVSGVLRRALKPYVSHADVAPNKASGGVTE
jgi:predicted DNA-binding transcriptional regulator YafY